MIHVLKTLPFFTVPYKQAANYVAEKTGLRHILKVTVVQLFDTYFAMFKVYSKYLLNLQPVSAFQFASSH